MSRLLSSLLPRRIGSQIAAVIVVSIVAIHVVLTAVFFLTRSDDRFDPGRGSFGQFATLVQLVDSAPSERRPALIADIGKSFPRLELAKAVTLPAELENAERNPPLDFLRRQLGPNFQLAQLEHPDFGHGARIAVRLRDGEAVTAWMQPRPPPLPRLVGPWSISLFSAAVVVTLLSLWATRALTAPLRAFAQAAEKFAPEGDNAPLPERGPNEIRAAARALNRMRERIIALVDDRTRMLAAVGHDLRTPITRMRLRSEFIADEALRAQMLADLDRMRDMIDAVLAFLRDGRAQEPATMIDLASSLQTICDEFSDLGFAASYEGPDHAVISARPGDLHRAIANLIDNAVRYGGKATVRLSPGPSSMVVTIEDDGPGIPDADREAMFQPFVRGDPARGMSDQSGFGLGLAIARATIEGHGGTLALRNRAPRGLIAEIVLPTARPADPASQ